MGPLLAMSSKYVETTQSGQPTLDFPWWWLLVFCVGLCAFGIFLAIPFRSRMIVRDKLPFPSGKATAILISSLQTGMHCIACDWR